LQNEENGLHYLEFDDKLELVEVIRGAKCMLSESAITRALGPLAEHVKVTKARASYEKFEMLEAI
jgi:hypothetical protein